jgi:cysteine-rich repeat protein
VCKKCEYEDCRDVEGECGDGKVEVYEECDDGNLKDGDGCSSICTIEKDYSCCKEPSVCTLCS